MIPQVLLYGFLAAVAGGAMPAAEERTPPAGTEGWERYEVLVERNIFSRDRGRPQRQERATYVPPPPPPERYQLMKGVVRQGEEWIAFLEDARTGTVSKVRVGDKVLEGRIAAITMDSIDYEKDDQVAHVTMGGNLEGGGTRRSSEGSAAPAPRGAPSATSSTAGASDMLERLRQRRQRELGR